ncbi:MAG: hypothetical protein NTX22_03530 [Ignavibacteriales bacterium]|nr:hypothetical protein [Ignavibacteriales bacterium]
MFKSLFLSVFFLSLFVSHYAQNKFAIEANAGFLSPFDSQKGLLGSVKVLYKTSDDFNLYVYSGYGFWDKNHVRYYDEGNKLHFESDENEHQLIPFYAGSRYYFNRNKYLDAFIESEIGMNILKFNSFDFTTQIDPENGKAILVKDNNSKKANNEFLVGLGFGIGFNHQLNSAANLTLAIKLNTMGNNSYRSLFSSTTTHFSFLAGFQFMI